MAGPYSVSPFRPFGSSLTFWIEIQYKDVSQEYAGWVRILVWSINFRQSYAPWTLKKVN